MKKGKVTLIGAGPGDKGLLTIKAYNALKESDVVVYDRLVSKDILDLSPENAEMINVGKVMNHHNIPQGEINKILLEKALLGKNVVRLKGGDPFVFGRGGEELELLLENNIEYEVIPGITSAVSALAYAGIPVTHRDYASSIHFITGHAKDGLVENINFKSLVAGGGTIIFYMGVSTLKQLTLGLIEAGMDENMPCVAVENGTRSNQRTLFSTVSKIYEEAQKFNLKSPAVIAVGKVCSLGNKFDYFTKNKLFGKKVIVPRAKISNNKLIDKLKSKGADALDFVCMQVQEMQNKEKLTYLIDNLNEYSAIVFSSKNSVIHFFKELHLKNKDSRALSHLKIVVIGKSSSDELLKYGIIKDYMPKEFESTSLAKEFESLQIKGKTAILEAKDDINSIYKAFINNNILSDLYECYEIEYKPYENAAVFNDYIEKNAVAAFTSSAAVYGFVKSCNIKDFSKIRAICIGKATYKKAQVYNFNTYMAEKPTIEALIEKISEME